MFFVVGTKIYLGTFDEVKKVYPECKLVKQHDGSIVVKKMTSGISKKPAHRRVCSLTELIARFGHTASEPEEKSDNEKD